MRKLLILPLFALAACATGGSYSERWTLLSQEHYRLVATTEGAAWERAFLPVHNTFWPDVYRTCGAQAKAAGIDKFQAVAVVDHTGLVKEFLPMPNSPHLKCFSEQMVGRKYPAPPVAPFYELFNFALDTE